MRSMFLGALCALSLPMVAMAADEGGSATGGTNDGPSDDAGSAATVEGKMSLADALGALDPTNDDHWTAAGLPAMKVLEEWTGGNLTRDDVNAASSGYNRDNASSPSSNATEHINAAASDVDGETVQEESAAMILVREAMQDAEGGFVGNDGIDAIKLFEAAVSAASLDRYRQNPELQAIVRMWQTQQRGVVSHQERIDARQKRRAERNADNGEAKAGTPDAIAA